MKKACIILLFLQLMACSPKYQEFDGVKGAEIIRSESGMKVRYTDNKFVTRDTFDTYLQEACHRALGGSGVVVDKHYRLRGSLAPVTSYYLGSEANEVPGVSPVIGFDTIYHDFLVKMRVAEANCSNQ